MQHITGKLQHFEANRLSTLNCEHTSAVLGRIFAKPFPGRRHRVQTLPSGRFLRLMGTTEMQAPAHAKSVE